MSAPEATPIWIPDRASTRTSAIARFARDVSAHRGADIDPQDYGALHAWSVAHLEDFWEEVWRFFGVRSHTPYTSVLDGRAMPGASWFQGATLSYAEHALGSGRDEDEAIVTVDEDGARSALAWRDLRAQVAAVASWLRASGVGRGDRVVGYLSNGAPAAVAFLATASIGAIWSVCAQDLASSGAVSRFAQLAPKVLVAADGYRWNGKRHDRRPEVAALASALPTLQATLFVSHLGLEPPSLAVSTTRWDDVLGGREGRDGHALSEPVPASTPLWILFSSGTTGVPKGIVHGHAGVLVDHLRILGLHFDLRAGERFFWHTTTHWMVWNLGVSALLLGATLVCYDGSPVFPTADRLWELAAKERLSVFGTSPGHLLASERAGVVPATRDLSALRVVGSSGSPLPASAYVWVRERVGARVQVNSAAGGTDVVSAFALSAPTTPVWAGEISAPALGVALDSWDSWGRPVVGEVGELVVTSPTPSMPLFFWNDADGRRYREAYFETYPGVWRHGDWLRRTEHGSFVITGRSDATLNRHGVRVGTADIYAVVEKIVGVREALVVGIELADGEYWMPLFVVLDDAAVFDDTLRRTITARLVAEGSPRHVPDDIFVVRGIPHTRTGKKLEVPVKRLLQGAALADVVEPSAVDDITLFEDFIARRRASSAVPLPSGA
jgi:acetoacetyl-CoA synthetase